MRVSASNVLILRCPSVRRRIWMERESPVGGEAEQIVSQDPQLPQGFYPVGKPTRFLPGDELKVTCEYDSMERTTPTNAGSTSKVCPHTGFKHLKS